MVNDDLHHPDSGARDPEPGNLQPCSNAPATGVRTTLRTAYDPSIYWERLQFVANLSMNTEEADLSSQRQKMSLSTRVILSKIRQFLLPFFRQNLRGGRIYNPNFSYYTEKSIDAKKVVFSP